MRTRIVSLAVVASALALVCFGLPLAIAVSQYAQVYREVDLERQADRAASRIALDLYEGEEIDNEQLEDYDTLTFRSAYDTEGRLLLGRGPSTADEFVRGAAEGAASAGRSGGDIVVAVPVTQGGDLVGVVRVSGSQEDLLWPVAVAWLGMGGLAVVALGLVWLLARRQACDVAWHQGLQRLGGVVAGLGGEAYLAHVRDVEQAAGIPGLGMLDQDAGRVLHRHFVAGKRHETRAEFFMQRIQRCALQGAGRNFDQKGLHRVAYARRKDCAVRDPLCPET